MMDFHLLFPYPLENFDNEEVLLSLQIVWLSQTKIGESQQKHGENCISQP